MIDLIIFKIKDHTEYPGPRYTKQGVFSGEWFYKKHIKDLIDKCLSIGKTLTIDLDGTAGYAASFIDELFGNIVYDFGLDVFKKTIIITSNEEPEWIDLVNDEVVKDWQIKKEKGAPKKPE